MEISLTYPEFRAVIRLLAAEVAACLPVNVPMSVDDLLMDRVDEIAEEVWYAIEGQYPHE